MQQSGAVQSRLLGPGMYYRIPLWDSHHCYCAGICPWAHDLLLLGGHLPMQTIILSPDSWT